MLRLAVLLASVLFASPASAADRCKPRGSERVAAQSRSSVVVSAARTTRSGQDLLLYRVCLRSSGRRTPLGTSSVDAAVHFRFAGRFVALVEEDDLVVTIADARWGRRLARSASLSPFTYDGSLVDLRLSESGHVSWLLEAESRSYLFARAGRRLLEIDRSTSERGLGAMRLRGRTLRWVRGGTARRRVLPPVR